MKNYVYPWYILLYGNGKEALRRAGKKLCRMGMVVTAGITAIMIMEFSLFSALGREKSEGLGSSGQGRRSFDKEWLMLRAEPAPFCLGAVNKEGKNSSSQEIKQSMGKEEKQLEEKDKPLEKEQTRYTDEDYQVLLNIVQAEAGNCDAIGKILVANVVLNRVKSEKFPDSVKEVVYEKAQFSPVSNGSINRVEVSASTADCVNRALNGEDYSRGALYFMNRRASQSGNVSWFDRKLTYLFQHQAHEFFK